MVQGHLAVSDGRLTSIDEGRLCDDAGRLHVAASQLRNFA
jgi:hypothetical protein